MGIPRFYRWISERYPQINQLISDVSLLPEFDNLYLDMNGIIHQCTHPNDEIKSSVSEKDMVLGIFTYIDRIVTHIVKPKKLLYLAVDGVAPRAKLNQQRSRRFRAGLELLEAKQLKAVNGEEDDDGEEEDLFDSNCITPGTEFMARISKHLKYFIRRKIKEDPMWQKITVIFSGHEVPGEGEHKIVEFIRNIKMQPGYPPNVRHCMYGSDADLMLLGISTHEPHFTLLREVVDWNRNSHKDKNSKKIVIKQTKEQEWQMVHLSLFREYLDFELRVDVDFYDTERALDDFVFMTFFLGNDFIPHSPTLEIGEDAIARLLATYRELLPTWGGYLTNAGKLEDPARLQNMFATIGTMEEQILTDRAEEMKKFNKRRNGRGSKVSQPAAVAAQLSELDEEDESKIDFEAALMEALEEKVYDQDDEADVEEGCMIVLEGSEGFQETKLSYYKKKFGISNDQPQLLSTVRNAYLEALLWCLAYYYQGVPSWTWFYPFHYAPMVSDLTDDLPARIKNVKFSIGKPLLPFQQLLSCLPAASSSLLPTCYRSLMSNSTSPIIDYYPTTFDIDMEGKRNPWEGVNILPFINSQKLVAAVKAHAPDSLLSADELGRNKLTDHAVILKYDSSVIDNIQSSFPEGGLPDIMYCNSFMMVFQLPASPTGGFVPALSPGVQMPLAGFPTLRSIPLSNVTLDSIGLNCFGMASRKESLILHLENSTPSAPPLDLIGSVVQVNWPNLHEARVVALSTIEGEYRSNSPDSFKAYVGIETDSWKQKARGESQGYHTGRQKPGTGGVQIGKVTTFVHVVALQGMVRDVKTGAMKKQFGSEEIMVPFQLVVSQPKVFDPRFQELPPPPLETRYPIGCEVSFITSKYKSHGVIGKVVQNAGKTLTISAPPLELEPPFGHVIATQFAERYSPGYLLAKKVGVSSNVLGRLVGAVVINPGKFNIGLNLKVKKQYKLLGYSQLKNKNDSGSSSNSGGSKNVWLRKNAVQIVGCQADESSSSQQNQEDGAWEYSERTLNLIAAYKRKFPIVFSSLSTLPSAAVYQLSDFFPNMSVNEAKALRDDIMLWLENLDTHKMTMVPVTTQSLPPHAFSAVEQAANVRQELVAKTSKALVEIPNVYPEHVFRPNPEANHDISSSAGFQKGVLPNLGDRVTNLTARSVPFGLRGTIVVIHPSSGCVEVLFDMEFVGGTTLNGLCSNYRGKLVPWTSLLTISSKPPPSSSSNASTARRNSGVKAGAAKAPKKNNTKASQKPKQQGSAAPKPANVTSKKKTEDFNALDPSEKMSALMQMHSKPRCELDFTDVETSGTADYYHQLQMEAANKPAPLPPAPATIKGPVTVPKKSSSAGKKDLSHDLSGIVPALRKKSDKNPATATTAAAAAAVVAEKKPAVPFSYASAVDPSAKAAPAPARRSSSKQPSKSQPKQQRVVVKKPSAGSSKGLLMPTQVLMRPKKEE